MVKYKVVPEHIAVSIKDRRAAQQWQLDLLAGKMLEFDGYRPQWPKSQPGRLRTVSVVEAGSSPAEPSRRRVFAWLEDLDTRSETEEGLPDPFEDPFPDRPEPSEAPGEDTDVDPMSLVYEAEEAFTGMKA